MSKGTKSWENMEKSPKVFDITLSQPSYHHLLILIKLRSLSLTLVAQLSADEHGWGGGQHAELKAWHVLPILK